MLVDTSSSTAYHANYRQDAARLYHNHLRNEPIPIGTPLIPVHYCRFAQQFKVRNRAQGLVSGLGLPREVSILVVGSGFGWLVEALQALLPSSEIVGIDTGAWVQSVKDQDESADIAQWLATETHSKRPGIEPDVLTPEQQATWLSRIVDGPRARRPILDEGLQNNGSRNRVLSEIAGSNFDLAISEHVIEWLEDAECQALSSNMRAIAANVVHVVTPFIPRLADPNEVNPWNWKWLRQSDREVVKTRLGDSTDLKELIKLQRVNDTEAVLLSKDWYGVTAWNDLLPSDTLFSADRVR